MKPSNSEPGTSQANGDASPEAVIRMHEKTSPTTKAMLIEAARKCGGMKLGAYLLQAGIEKAERDRDK